MDQVFERGPNPDKARNLVVHLVEFCLCPLTNIGTVRFWISTQHQQFLDLVKRKAEALRFTNETNAAQRFGGIATVAAIGRFAGLLDEPFALIEANGFNANSSFFCNFADPHSVPDPF